MNTLFKKMNSPAYKAAQHKKAVLEAEYAARRPEFEQARLAYVEKRDAKAQSIVLSENASLFIQMTLEKSQRISHLTKELAREMSRKEFEELGCYAWQIECGEYGLSQAIALQNRILDALSK